MLIVFLELFIFDALFYLQSSQTFVIVTFAIKREKERDLTQSYAKTLIQTQLIHQLTTQKRLQLQND